MWQQRKSVSVWCWFQDCAYLRPLSPWQNCQHCSCGLPVPTPQRLVSMHSDVESLDDDFERKTCAPPGWITKKKHARERRGQWSWMSSPQISPRTWWNLRERRMRSLRPGFLRGDRERMGASACCAWTWRIHDAFTWVDSCNASQPRAQLATPTRRHVHQHRERRRKARPRTVIFS